jgi:exopolysaccharide production protein ExoZ
MGRLQSIQILRGVAALMVCWTHADHFAHDPLAGAFPGLSQSGAAGVDIFFVISGAIIYLSAGNYTGSPAQFLWRRLLRIAPLYYLISATFLLLSFWLPWPPHGLSNAITTVTFKPPWDHQGTPILWPGWTLSFELLFYTAMAFVIWRRLTAVAIIILAILSAVVAHKTGWKLAAFLGNPMMLEFAAGTLIAAIWKHYRPARLVPGAALVMISAVWFYYLNPPAGTDDFIRTVDGEVAVLRIMFWGIPAALMVAGALMIEPYVREGSRLLRIPVFLGDASYSIYLVHWPVIILVAAAMNRFSLIPTDIFVATALLFLSGIAAGNLAYLFLEKKLLAINSRRLLCPPEKVHIQPSSA